MWFPLFLDLMGRRVVVIGGGPVGRRRATLLHAAGAVVRLVCLEPAPIDWRTLASEWLSESFRPEHLEGAFLVIAAATPTVNRQVVEDARSRGILANQAGGSETSDFQFPAMLSYGDLVIAISTGGAAPALARRIRQEIEARLDDSVGPWLELLAELRQLVREKVADPERRRTLLQQLVEPSWHERFVREGAEAVRQAIRDLV